MTYEELHAELQHAYEENRLCNYANAEEIVRKVAVVCDGLDKEATKGEQLRAFGNIVLAESLCRRGRFREALVVAELSASYYLQSGTPSQKAYCLMIIGEIKTGLSDYTSAKDYLHQAEDFAKQAGDTSRCMDIKNCWGMIFIEIGEYSNAHAMFSEVFNDSQEAEYALQRQYSLCGIGDCGLFSGDYEKSDRCYRLALEIGNVSNNIFLNALCIKGIGTMLLVQGNCIESLEYLQKSLLLYRTIDAQLFIGKVLISMGSSYQGIGDYDLSLASRVEALKVFEQCGSVRNVAASMGHLAILYSFLENFDKSEEHFLIAIKMFESLSIDCSTYIGNYAKLLYKYGQTDKAIEYFQQISLIFQKNNRVIEENLYNYYLCELYINNGEFAKTKEIALRRYQVALEYSRNDEIPNALLNLAELYANQAFPEHNDEIAEQYYLQSVQKFVESGNQEGVRCAYQSIAEFYKRNRRWEEYAKSIEKSMEMYKQIQNDEIKKQADRFGWERKVAEAEREKALELARAEAEKALLEQEIILQKREIEVGIHELVSKNNFLSEIRKEVRLLSKYTVREGNDVVERLLDRLERNIVPLESKTELEQQWSEVHGPFMDRLKELHPSLTAMELKICALLKMKLTSSNICSILFLSKRTVEFHRLNIRKKMNLAKGDDIYVVLNLMGESGVMGVFQT